MKSLKNLAKSLWKDESGQGTAEYVLLVAIVVALVIAFKKPLMEAMNKKIGDVTGQISGFDTGSGQ